MDQNEIKKISSLSQGKYRKNLDLFVVDGVHATEELIKSSWDIDSLVVTHEASEDKKILSLIKEAERRRVRVVVVNQKIFSKLSTTESPQGVLAVARLPRTDLGRLISQKRILIADAVADPGNLGTMMRAATAFGFGGLVTTPGSVDIFSPKTVRAAQGAMFHLELANHLDYKDIAQKIRPSHKIYSLSTQARTELQTVKPAIKSALVVGAEIAGVSEEILAISDQVLKISMSGPVESLNAAMAAGIAMYEFSHRG